MSARVTRSRSEQTVAETPENAPTRTRGTKRAGPNESTGATQRELKRAKVKESRGIKRESLNEDDSVYRSSPKGKTRGSGNQKPARITAQQEVKEEEEEEEEAADATKKTPRKRKTTKKTTAESIFEMKPLAPRTQGFRMYIGAHVSAAKGIYNAIGNSEHIGGNAFALFLKSQRKWDNPPLESEIRDKFRKHCSEYAYDASKFVLPHGSYLVNLAQEDPAKAKQAYSSFLDDLNRCEDLGIRLYNFHPGATNKTTLESSLSRLAKSLISALDSTTTVIPVLETTCGHGTTIGGPLEHFRDLFSLIPESYHPRLGVCLDTCHSFAAGYDLRDPDSWNEFMEEFDRIVGLKFLRALHLNDSKTPLGSRRDLHANIGTGFLGLRAFHNVMNDTRLEGLPMVLETPIDRPADQVNQENGEEEREKKSTAKKKTTSTPAKNPKNTVEDKSVWAREIKLLESLIGMDRESEKFLALEKELAEEGREEREKHQAQFEKKVEKESKQQTLKSMLNGSTKKRGSKKKAKSEREESSEGESEG